MLHCRPSDTNLLPPSLCPDSLKGDVLDPGRTSARQHGAG